MFYRPVDSSGNNTTIPATAILSEPFRGFYTVFYTLACITSQTTAATAQVQFDWTGEIGARSVTSSALTLTATGETNGSFPLVLSSGDLTYKTNLPTAVTGAALYSLHIRIVPGN